VSLHPTTEHRLLQSSAREYCDRSYSFRERQRILQTPEGWSRDHWTRFAALNWLGVAVPEDVGGAGGSLADAAILAEQFGRALMIEPFVPGVVLAAGLLDRAGSASQRTCLLPRVVSGQLLLALAHGEPDGHGAALTVQTRATQRPGGGYQLTGRKTLVLGGSIADLLLVTARVEGRSGEGLGVFVVDPAIAGVRPRPYRLVDGTPAADVAFDDVAIDEAARLGDDGDLVAVLELALEDAILCACAEAVGAMERVATLSGDYLKTRRAFGTTLSTFQALQHRLADIWVEVELSRSILARAIAADPSARRLAVSAAKALIGRSGRWVGSSGVQLHGGLGMSDDYVIGHFCKRLAVFEALFGNSNAHLDRLAAAGLRSTADDRRVAAPVADLVESRSAG
jgi:alkylation response protein AidB-like acyl-CoA dehydrogenase